MGYNLRGGTTKLDELHVYPQKASPTPSVTVEVPDVVPEIAPHCTRVASNVPITSEVDAISVAEYSTIP